MAAIAGINAAAITPRREGPEIDLAAVFELIDFLAASGVNGISLAGSTGEFPHFTPDERARLVALAVKRSRVPVIAGVGHTTLDGALWLAREAAGAGAAALLLPPPYFYRYAQDDIREFYLRAARGLNGAAPLFLYNIPAFASGIGCGTAIELLTTGLFAGIKDSSGRWDDLIRLKEARARCQFTLLVGNEAIFAQARTAGIDGLISGAACAIPELLLALDRAIAAGKTETAARLDARLREFMAWMDRLPMPIGIREAAARRGLKTGPPAVPPGARTQAQLAEFREWFQGWLPNVNQECANE